MLAIIGGLVAIALLIGGTLTVRELNRMVRGQK